MQENHIIIEFNWSLTSYGILDVHVISRFKENRSKIDEYSIQNRVQFHLILNDIWLNLVGKIIIDRVSHILRLKQLLKFFLINDILVKGFNKNVKTSFLFIRIKANTEDVI